MNDARGHIYMKSVFFALCALVLVMTVCSNDDSSDSIITDKDVIKSQHLCWWRIR